MMPEFYVAGVNITDGCSIYMAPIYITPMTSTELAKGGASLVIDYGFAGTPFGRVIIAATSQGVCGVFFEDDKNTALLQLKQRFPSAQYRQVASEIIRGAVTAFSNFEQLSEVPFHVKASAFQLQVWRSLLRIPFGSVVTYGDLACLIGRPRAARAVGSAVGSNSVALLIPCHRVVPASGGVGEYRWGARRKTAILQWEGVK